MLYIVPTPIGNLEDLTFRALRLLKTSDLILAEDIRSSKKLLDHYEIQTPLKSYHMYNEHKSLPFILNELKTGKTLSLISDAGTPGISDPGFLLVRACIQANIQIECLPGATAFIPALVQSGFPIHEFTFIGFLPPKKGRKTKLESLSKEPRTLVLYESPHKLVKTLYELKECFGPEKHLTVCRELSKKFEETIRRNLHEMILHFESQSPRGEFILVLESPLKKSISYEKKTVDTQNSP
ncbi:MAG: 16S rRNA (cytidine(1402)-2'-O)-methyltransferase [Flavobacteriales bacterium AspAUS03]